MKKFILMFTATLCLSAYTQLKPNAVSLNETEVVLKTQTGNIYGLLSVPQKNIQSSLIIIIPGSGPTDKNCNSEFGLKTNAYKMLSESLLKEGISCLRYDKRGIGESKGAMKNESDIRIEDYVNDLIGWVNMFKEDKRFNEIILLGHSEGSLIGMIAADSIDVDAFISVSGAAYPADIVLTNQLKTNLPPDLLFESNRILDSLKKGVLVEDVNPKLNAIYRLSVQPYLISWIKYDPQKIISEIYTPTLIIQGTTDLQVSVENAELLSKAASGSELKIIENMNHVLKESPMDFQQNMATYADPEKPLHYEFVKAILEFIEYR